MYGALLAHVSGQTEFPTMWHNTRNGYMIFSMGRMYIILALQQFAGSFRNVEIK
jgi:hypothetical protein